MTLKASHNVTFSQESACGLTPCAAQDGQTIAPSGQGLAPVSLSARQAKEKDLLTSGTYGPPFIGLLESAALSLSLASNLQALTQMSGSTMYKLTWKVWGMPSGRSRSRLRASVRRISEIGLIGWPTPIATDGSKDARTIQGCQRELERKGRLSSLPAVATWNLLGWPTPTASNVKTAYQDAEKVIARKAAGRQSNLQDFACLAGWPTPAARDGRGGVSGRKIAQWQDINGYLGCNGADCGPGPVNGFWRSADWLYCRDGGWRPVKPGLKPLANGVAGRVGKLRAYGNAVNALAAEAFIKSYMAAVE